MEELNPSSRSDHFGSKIDRAHSPLIANGLPFVTILLGALAPLFPLIADGPFMIFIAWQIVRPGLLPMWVGIPLGAFDDLFSGQPFGSAIMLWSITMLVLEIVEARFPWRGFWQDWLTAAAVLTVYLSVAALVSGTGLGLAILPYIVPQILLSILLFPIIARIIAVFDRMRLLRIRDVSDATYS